MHTHSLLSSQDINPVNDCSTSNKITNHDYKIDTSEPYDQLPTLSSFETNLYQVDSSILNELNFDMGITYRKHMNNKDNITNQDHHINEDRNLANQDYIVDKDANHYSSNFETFKHSSSIEQNYSLETYAMESAEKSTYEKPIQVRFIY